MRLEEMVEWFERRLEYRRAHPTSPSEEYYIEAMRDYFQEASQAKEEGRPLAWISPLAPIELLRAMDIVHFGPDQYAIQVLAQKKGYEYLDLGGGVGFSTEGCSPNRAVVGMAKAGILPRPDVIVAVASPCDSNVMMFELVSEIFECPTYYFDYPYTLREGAIDYLRAELEGLINFLEKHTNRKIDWDLLEENLSISFRSHELVEKIQGLRKRIPCPLRSREVASTMALRICCEGSPAALRALEALYAEGSNRAARGRGALPQERHRLAWLGGILFSEMNLLDWLESKFQAVIVADGLGLRSWEGIYEQGKDPLERLARRMLGFVGIDLIYRPLHLSMDNLIQLLQESRIDGAIYFCHFGCKQMSGVSRMIVDRIRRDLGIAPLVIGGDSCDARITPASEVKDKIDQYLTTIVEVGKRGEGKR